jgi:NAD-reducing hydrogenase small subunit
MDQVNAATTAKAKVATAWLGGCSGCHMSFVDLDETLMDIAPKIELVYSPIVDTKEFPEGVDVTLIEGAICNAHNLHLAQQIRQRSKVVISFGDCAVNGNVPAMRNTLPKSVSAVLDRAYMENATLQPQIPQAGEVLPQLCEKVLPVHEVIKVDIFLPGCPPAAPLIAYVLTELLEGRTPDLSDKLKYG